jgi:hypothetical protein
MTATKQEEILKIVSDERKFQEFINLQDDFANSKFKGVYKSYLDGVLKRTELSKIEIDNVFNLVLELDYFDKRLVDLIKKNLLLKHSYLVKLNMLLFLFKNRNRISKEDLLLLNKNVLKQTKNDLLKIVSLLYLYPYNNLYHVNILKIIDNIPYPTPFYLLVNTMYHLSPQELIQYSKLISGLRKILRAKKYNKDVKKELSEDLKSLMQRI